MNEELVVVKTFGYVWQADLAQAALEEAGIESYLAGVNVWVTAPYAADPAGVKLQVRRDDVDEAVRMLEDLRPSVCGVSNTESTDGNEEH
jgi:hypothetical protein